MSQLFTGIDHTANYSKYRLLCPKEVVEEAIEFGKKFSISPPYGHLLDIGCGSGQATKAFAPHAVKITAIDISENQIKQAKIANKSSHVTFQVGTGENLPVEDTSVDVIISNQAIHWVNFEKFLRECDRVLTPVGFIVLSGYMGPAITAINKADVEDPTSLIKATNERLQKVVGELPHHPNTKPLVRKYSDILSKLPSENKSKIDFKVPGKQTLADFSGEFQTWSAYQTLMNQTREKLMIEYGKIDQQELDKHDVVKNYIKYVRELWGITEDSNNVELGVEWEVFTVLSTRPFI